MNLVYRSTKRVEFRDTDAAGIMHFSTYYTYMEEAEHEFLRSLGLSVSVVDGGQHLSWPRVATSCQYRDALRFEDEFYVDVLLERRGKKSVTYGFQFFRGKDLVAEGRSTAVFCRLQAGRRPESIPIPGWIAAKLDSAEFTAK